MLMYREPIAWDGWGAAPSPRDGGAPLQVRYRGERVPGRSRHRAPGQIHRRDTAVLRDIIYQDKQKKYVDMLYSQNLINRNIANLCGLVSNPYNFRLDD